MQTRFHSFIETMTSTLIGYIVALLSQAIIFPLFGIQTTWGDNMIIAGYFTVISIIRSYVVRRWFNHLGSDLDDFLARIFVGFKKGGIVPGAKTLDEHDPNHWIEIGDVVSVKVDGEEQGPGKGKLYIAKK